MVDSAFTLYFYQFTLRSVVVRQWFSLGAVFDHAVLDYLRILVIGTA